MDIAELRRIYARQMLAVANASTNVNLEDAYAAVPRQAFLGDGEWRINTPWLSYALIPNDPALIYQDVVVALDRERGVNNGSPSLHARWLNVVTPRRGETVAHIGAGAGYYSAILSELVGSHGRVTAIEFDAALAARARANLADRPNVEFIEGNGFDWPQAPADVVYVNFAASRPATAWIENLTIGGRLIFPLGVPRAGSYVGGHHVLNAVALVVTRHADGYAAEALGRVSFVYAESVKPAIPQKDIDGLRDCLGRKPLDEIKSLVWRKPQNPSLCWFDGADWALTSETVR
jgi:protein-L-isoaspartate(D-aspartate) O-methyltransferase